jgi:anaerobic dimethyl sulfoxide reductase subunit C (anchor subunit)
MGDRSLVVFTLLAQAGCGALVGLVGIQTLGGPDVLGPVSLVAIDVILLTAMAVSTLHLGAPRHAPYAVLNWRTSWLSREILTMALVGGLVALDAVIGLIAGYRAATAGARTVLALLAAVAGCALVLSMARLYAVRTIPEWNPATTGLRFAGSTLRLGTVVAGLLAAATVLPEGALGSPARWLAALLAAGIFVELVARRQRDPAAGPSPGGLLVRKGADRPMPASLAQLAAAALLGAAGVVLLATGPAIAAVAVLAGALIVLAAAEVALRERFYALAPRRGRSALRTAASPKG